MNFKQTVIFICLLFLGLGLFVSFNQEYEISFTKLGSAVDIKSSRKEGRLLLTGDILSADFKATYKNLGQIAVRFNNLNRDSTDILEFRIKRSGAEYWFYKASYNTDQFLPDKLFSFGFPVISNSENIDFHFEIESTKGSTESGIALSKVTPQATAIHGFSKVELMGDGETLKYFLINKLKGIATDPILLASLVLYFLPAVFYLFLVYFKTLYIIPLGFILIFFTSQVTKPDSIHSFQYLLIPLMWIVLSTKHFVDYKVTVYFSASLLFLGVYSLLRINPDSAEIYLSWGYLFLFTSFAQLLLIQKNLLVQKVSPKDLLSNLKRQSLFLLRKARDFFHYLTNEVNGFKTSLIKVIILVLIFSIVGIMAYSSFQRLKTLQDIYTEYYQSKSWIYFLKFCAFKLSILYLLSVYVGRAVFKYFKNFLPATLVTIVLISYFQPFLIGMDKNVLTMPRISTVSPNTIHESWTDVVITGHNFKDLPFEGKVVLGGVDQYLLISWTDKKIIFRTNPDTTKTGDLIVVTTDGKRSNEVELKYTFEY